MDIKSIARTLYTRSSLEWSRIPEEFADPRSLQSFKEIETLVRKSYQKNPPPTKVLEKKAFEDRELVKKLVQHRHQFKTSGRIIRKKEK